MLGHEMGIMIWHTLDWTYDEFTATFHDGARIEVVLLVHSLSSIVDR